MYNTVQRKAILSFLEANTGKAFTVKEIVRGIQEDASVDHKPSESTVYRIMNALAESGVIHRSIDTDRSYKYISCSNPSSEIRLLCRKCGSIRQIDENVCSEVMDELDGCSIRTNEDIDILISCKKCLRR